MKKLVCTLIIISGMLILIVSCKHKTLKDSPNSVAWSSELSPDLIVVAKDIITEVIVKPDTLGDPWEVEKVRNYNGKLMFTNLFENIYSKKVTVYDNLTGAPLDPGDVRKMEKEFGSDVSKIAKIQFLEDWYFNPSTNKIIKKIKSVSFGYESTKEDGFPVRYKALFRLNIDQ
jgi:Icc-related predicted phosphoesterase